MRILVVAIPAALVATLVGVNLGWRWVLAPLLALALLRWSVASLRVLVVDAGEDRVDEEGPSPLDGPERTLFWCEECGTEVMLVVRGTARAPSHCGQRMHERTELLG
jgi:hypothetical protein